MKTKTKQPEKKEIATTAHVSVMPKEVLDVLAPNDKDMILDATAGAGGHDESLLSATKKAMLIALDADPVAVRAVTKRLKVFGDRAIVLESNFSAIPDALKRRKVSKITKALFDLGWNRTQLSSGRGFSFLQDEPLSMSYGKKPASGCTARDIVNEWGEETLADVIFGFGEERYSRRIARAIVLAREVRPIETTFQLVDVISRSVPAAYRRGRLHPATKTFQALRIAVNAELRVLDEGLAGAWNMLAQGGRLAVITFHSIEDRTVKKKFAAWQKSGEGQLLFKKPLVPSREEVKDNPPSRSAKLRAIERL